MALVMPGYGQQPIQQTPQQNMLQMFLQDQQRAQGILSPEQSQQMLAAKYPMFARLTNQNYGMGTSPQDDNSGYVRQDADYSRQEGKVGGSVMTGQAISDANKKRILQDVIQNGGWRGLNSGINRVSRKHNMG
jgi:hypothetical protein